MRIIDADGHVAENPSLAIEAMKCWTQHVTASTDGRPRLRIEGRHYPEDHGPGAGVPVEHGLSAADGINCSTVSTSRRWPNRAARRIPEGSAGAVRRIRAAARAARLDHPPHQGRGRGPQDGERTRGAARRLARCRAARCNSAPNWSFTRVPRRHSKAVGRSHSWPAKPRCTPSRPATRLCTPGSRATAPHSTRSVDSSSGRRPSDYRGVAVVRVPLRSVSTVYQRRGDWVVVLAFLVVMSAGVVAALQRPDSSDLIA